MARRMIITDLQSLIDFKRRRPNKSVFNSKIFKNLCHEGNNVDVSEFSEILTLFTCRVINFTDGKSLTDSELLFVVSVC